MKTKTSSKRNRSRDRKSVVKQDHETGRAAAPRDVETVNEPDKANKQPAVEPKAEDQVSPSESLPVSSSHGLDVSSSSPAAPEAGGMSVEDREAMLAFLGREEAAEDFEKVDPGRFNHAVLVFIRCVIDALRLRPFQVEAQTGVKHQHLHKMRPHEGAVQEVHITLCTLACFCNGLHIRVQAALDWIMRRLLLTLLPLLEPLEA